MQINETLYLGDRVEMRKSHPCGSRIWHVVRVGADIGLLCEGCGRRVLLPRRKFARNARRFLSRGRKDDSGGGSESDETS